MSDPPVTGLRWGIKTSFLRYVSGMPDGRGTVSGGATPVDGNIMVFERAPGVERPASLAADHFLAFRGDVRFAAHAGLLFVRIADPWIAITGNQAEMTVLDPYKPDEDPRLPLVRFTLTSQEPHGNLEILRAPEVRLTVEGTTLFNDVYQPGELFEPIEIVLPSTAPAPQPAPSPDPLSRGEL